MNVIDVETVLAAEGLVHPDFHALEPNQELYSIALFQPSGEITLSEAGVFRSSEETAREMTAFLQMLVEKETSLGVCPEYSMPISVVSECIGSQVVPPLGSIWVLGCESIEINSLDSTLDSIRRHAKVIAETVDQKPGKRFVNPVIYLFKAEPIGGGEPLPVLIVQYKTSPMGGHQVTEMRSMACGTRLYRFGTKRKIGLVTLVCADVMGISDAIIEEIYEDCLILHLQLNTGFRQATYRRYRDKLFEPACDRTELVCLNWSSPVVINGEEVSGFGGSAWYLNPGSFDDSDEAIDGNHRRGLYYTWSKNLHAHTLFLNRDPGVYVMEASKVKHGFIPGEYQRIGPVALEYLRWSGSGNGWEPAEPEAGFDAFSELLGSAAASITALDESSPIAAERVINLSVGKLKDADWYLPEHLETLQIDQSERIGRLTYCQESDSAKVGDREAMFLTVAELERVLDSEAVVPVPMKDLCHERTYSWQNPLKHQNLIGEKGPATAVHLVGAVTKERHFSITKILARLLRRDIDDLASSRRARARLAVFASHNGETAVETASEATDFTNPDDSKPFDFTEGQ